MAPHDAEDTPKPDGADGADDKPQKHLPFVKAFKETPRMEEAASPFKDVFMLWFISGKNRFVGRASKERFCLYQFNK